MHLEIPNRSKGTSDRRTKWSLKMFAVWNRKEERARSVTDIGAVVQYAATLLEKSGIHARVGILDNRFVPTSTDFRGQWVFVPTMDESPESLASRALQRISY